MFLHPHAAAVDLCDEPDQGQPQTGAAQFPGAGGIHPEEGLKDPLPQLRRDVGSLIGHGDDHIGSIQFRTEPYLSALRSVFHCIFHQIEQRPAEQFSGTSGDTELFEKPSNINGFRASEQKTILYIPPFQGDCFEVAALFYAQNKCVN